MNYLEVKGVVHEVTCEHFASSGDGFRGLKLDLRCGGHVFLDPDLPWKHEGFVTCLWCIAGASRHRIDYVEFKATVQ